MIQSFLRLIDLYRTKITMRKQTLSPQVPNSQRTIGRNFHKRATAPNGPTIIGEAAFNRQIYLERRRAERTGHSLLLLLMDGAAIADMPARSALFRAATESLPAALRDTDFLGWYRKNRIVGVLLPDLMFADTAMIRAVVRKISSLLRASLGAALAEKVQLTIHVFPDPLKLSGDLSDFTLYPELPQQDRSQQFQALLKRGLDICASLLLGLLLWPLLALVALAIKCSSRGPVLFRQERLGRYGRPFTFLKFRTMYPGSDARLHQGYVTKFIAGLHTGSPAGVFKITDDPRITPLGRMLRTTSLDELPQLWNILRGEMSLVGPRPPLRYEFESYAPWHRRRILESKPGLTGLWQVQGRSRTGFDEMVRLDLRYARGWSLWLDLKILFRTPAAVISGRGAY